ncbi:MAG: MiaB/RimO family radical SAM methylthiotransferase [bacterium]|nr:MiaB/RimO family radical SAM methylthiotransferase [bacterium]
MQHYFIQTFGCQMNEADSERIASLLEDQGYTLTTDWQQVDVLVLNSCSVRQASEDKIYGWGKKAAELKKKNPKAKIILAGCLVGSAEGERKRISLAELKKKTPWVDEYWKPGQVGFAQPANQGRSGPALVPISTGCNHFCSYCVVPYARGPEKSRPMAEIVCEVERLVGEGTKEVLLLGQNVNTYGTSCQLGKGDLTPFVKLLKRLHKIEGLQKISFLTSHPKDMSDELIEALNLPKMEKYLHLPVQAGDDEILRRMNRGYTAKQYLDLITKIRKKVPGLRIGTDVIVGFPGETEEQFKNTIELFKKAEFDVAYVAVYSPREGTAAAKMKDDVPLAEKKARYKSLMTIFEASKL